MLSLKRFFLLCLVLAVFCPAGLAFGQGVPSGKWWNRPGVIQSLGLTEEERIVLDEKFAQSQRKRFDLKAAVQRERFDLDQALAADPLDERAVFKQFDRFAQARKALDREQFAFLVEVRKVLGKQRFTKLKNRFQDFKRNQRNRQGLNRNPGRR